MHERHSNCPVCGWPGVPENRHQEICHCCYTQFGLDDLPYPPEIVVRGVSPEGELGPQYVAPNPSPLQTQEAVWAALRAEWIREGMPWRGTRPPKQWDPIIQLRNIGVGI